MLLTKGHFQIYAELKIGFVHRWLKKSLNNCMISSIHKQRTYNLDLVMVVHDFCSGKEKRWSTFGNFQEKDLGD